MALLEASGAVAATAPYPLAVTARDRLHRLVEELDQKTVERLVARWDEVVFLVSDWEPDDSPLTPAQEAAVREAQADLAAGRVIAGDELAARLAEVRRRVAVAGLDVSVVDEAVSAARAQRRRSDASRSDSSDSPT